MEFINIEQNHVMQIGKIEQDIFESPYSIKSIEQMMSSKDYHYIVAFEEQVIGYVGVSIVLDECDITHIAVKNECRGHHIASKLMEELVSFCKEHDIVKIHLEVRGSNDIALGLYKKFGFLEVGNRKNYYKNPTENAILMTLEV